MSQKIISSQVGPNVAAGTIASSVFGSTGNKSVAGLGFKPKMVEFTLLAGNSTANSASAEGVMTPTAQWVSSTFGTGSNNYRQGSTSACIGYTLNGSAFAMLSSYVSMDEDGFTINVGTAGTDFSIGWKAFG